MLPSPFKISLMNGPSVYKINNNIIYKYNSDTEILTIQRYIYTNPYPKGVIFDQLRLLDRYDNDRIRRDDGIIEVNNIYDWDSYYADLMKEKVAEIFNVDKKLFIDYEPFKLQWRVC